MFNIVQKKFIFMAISLVIILAGVVCFFINGFNQDIDFAGGTQIVITGIKYDEKAITKSLESIKGVDVSTVQKTDDGVLVKTKFLSDDLKTQVETQIPKDFKKAKVASVERLFFREA